jgi:hypothetical protein
VTVLEVYVRSSRHGRDTLVAVCDAELLGETLEGGRVPFEVSERFYKGTLVGPPSATSLGRGSWRPPSSVGWSGGRLSSTSETSPTPR